MERWVDEIEDWETRSVDDGYRGLQSLASVEFSGAVAADGTWLFMVKGRGVGVFEYRQQPGNVEVVRSDIEQFEDADLTAYVSPHPAVPMLVAMQAGETETRGRYYTEDTPIREVHDTLQDGGFTGYLELSENVLSGDYYVVYQAGRSMEVAFIGSSRRLETDDDAFDRAANEVGIYEVVSADLQPVDIPEPKNAGGAATGTAGTAGATGADTAAAAETEDSSDPDPSEAALQNESTEDEPARGQNGTATTPSDSAGQQADDDATASGTAPSTDAANPDPATDTEKEPASQEADIASDTASQTEDIDSADAPSERTETPESPSEASREPAESESVATDAEPDEGSSGERDTSGAASDPSGSIVNREVPALDPERSGASGDVADTRSTESRTNAGTDKGSTTAGQDRVSELETQLAERESELQDARVRLEEVRADLDRVQTERDELRGRVSELEAEIKELRAAVDAGGVESTREDTQGGATANRSDSKSLSPGQALSETNLFVRYRSKGKTTLDDVHDGADPDALADNLRLEHHTEFEDESATIGGEPFEAWLHDTVQFRFLRWLTTVLPFEIRDTGATDGLAALYTALPEIDRVELAGSIEADTTDGQREVEFDVVIRDRMGEPLAVVQFDDSRDPVTESQLADLVKSTTNVAERRETLASAFFVAKSYFDPDALDTAREATSGSLLSRDKRRSFVKLSRNQGYHLCLVEARDGAFHLSVPDL